MHVAPMDDNLVVIVGQPFDGALLGGGQPGQRKKAEMSLPGRNSAKRFESDQVPHLGGRANERRELEPQHRFQVCADCYLMFGRRTGRAE